MRMLFNGFGRHYGIAVYDTTELYGEKGNFRVLQFPDGAIQGAMDLNDPGRIVFEYPRAMIHLMEYNRPTFDHVFIIGHGIGTIAGYFPDRRCKIAELDGIIVELSRKYFGYCGDNVIVGDGRRLLEEEDSFAYDFIIVDAFTDKGTPRQLTSTQFFELAKEKLHPQGFIMMNVIGKGSNRMHVNAIHSTLHEVYAYTKVFALPSEGANGIQNLIIIGGNKPIGFQTRHMAGFVEAELEQGHIIADPH